MALINKLDNTGSITYNGSTIKSNTVTTLLLLAPTIVKTVDKTLASVGDTLTYTVTITNIGLSDITNLPFTDVLPSGSTYAAGTFKLNDTTATPTVTSGTLTYTIPSIAALGIAKISFQADIVGGSI